MGRLGCRKCRKPGARGGRWKPLSFLWPHSRRLPANSVSSNNSPRNSMAGELRTALSQPLITLEPPPYCLGHFGSLPTPTFRTLPTVLPTEWHIPRMVTVLWTLKISHFKGHTIYQEDRKGNKTLTFFSQNQLSSSMSVIQVKVSVASLGPHPSHPLDKFILV